MQDQSFEQLFKKANSDLEDITKMQEETRSLLASIAQHFNNNNQTSQNSQLLDPELKSAIEKSQPKLVEKLIKEQKKSPNLPDENGNYALHIAAQVKCTLFNKNAVLDVIRTLIDANADVTQLNRNDQTPIEVALDEEKNNKLHNWSKTRMFIGRRVPQEKDHFHYILCEAVTQSKTDFVQFCLENGVSPNLPNKEGNYPLHIAAQNNQQQILSLLLDHFADISTQNQQSKTAIQIAVDNVSKNGWKCVVLLVDWFASLIDHSPTFNLDNIFKKTNINGLVYAINEAIKQDNREIVATLLDKLKAIITTYYNKNFYSLSTKELTQTELQNICDSNYFLDNAIQNSNSHDMVLLVLKYHASPTRKGKDEKTPIQLAVDNAHKNGWKCVHILVDHLIEKAKISQQIDQNLINHQLNDLFYALNESAKKDWSGSIEFSTQLISTPFTRLTKQIEDYIHHAIVLKTTTFTLDRMTITDFYQQTSYPLLHSAAQNPNPARIIANLLFYDVDVTKTDKNDKTPIQILADLGNWEGVLAMAEGKKDTDGKGRYGYALTKAAQANKTDIVAALLKAGANTNTPYNGCYPLHYAAEHENLKLIKLLLAKGANPNQGEENSGAQLPIDIAASKVFCSLFIKNWDCVFAFINEENPSNNPKRIFNNALAAAAHIGNLGVIKRLQKAGANLNSQNSGRGNTPLHYAAEQGHHEMVVYLLAENVAIATKNTDGGNIKTALQLAADNAKEKGWKCVLTIAKKMAEQSTANNNNADIDIDGLVYAIELAIQQNEIKIANELISNAVLDNKSKVLGRLLHEVATHPKAAELIPALLEKKADISYTISRHTHDEYRRLTPIQSMAEAGNWNGVIAMAKAQKDHDGKGQYGKALIAAVNKPKWQGLGPLQVIEPLLAAGASNSVTDEEMKQLIDCATDNILADDGKLLLGLLGTKPDLAKAGYFDRALVEATRYGQDSIMQALLEAGASPNHLTHLAKYPLHLATEQSNVGRMQLLLKHGADATLRTTDQANNSAIALALSAEKANLVEDWKCVLALATNRKSSGDDDYHHALTEAISKGKTHIVEALLDAETDLDKPTIYPLLQAVELGHFEITKTLLAKNADITKSDSQGNTALHIAAQKGNVRIVNLLLAFNANKTAENNNKQKPLDLATNKDCVTALSGLASVIAKQHASAWLQADHKGKNFTEDANHQL